MKIHQIQFWIKTQSLNSIVVLNTKHQDETITEYVIIKKKKSYKYRYIYFLFLVRLRVSLHPYLSQI